MENWEKIHSLTTTWILEAGENIRKALSEKIDIQTKSNRNDLVTNVDQQTEQFFIDKIRKTFPSHNVLGEEGFGDSLTDTKGVIWIIDPIDGTMNFVHQQRNFAISIGIYEDGIGQAGYIYDVIRDELFFAKKGEGAYFNGKKLPQLKPVSLQDALLGINGTWLIEHKRFDQPMITSIVKKARGTRSIGSAAIEIAYVAAGWLDGYISMRLSPWDYAAGKMIIEELGGKVTNLQGEPLTILEKDSVLIAKHGLYEEILQMLKENTK